MTVRSRMHNGLSTGVPLLVLSHVSKHFGGVTALNDVSFEIQQGELLGVIGPNGAGKSTVLSLIAGVERPSSGKILFDGQRLERLPPHAIARLGIGRAHQIPRPFAQMTIQQNVLVPIHSHRLRAMEAVRHTDEIIEVCGLQHKAHQLAATLTLLDLKRLEIARALALHPRLLLLDEVVAGLVGHEVDEVTRLIASIQANGMTILLVEHIQAVIQQLAERVLVLDWGRKIVEGTPNEVAKHPQVKAVYFGTDQLEPLPTQASKSLPHVGVNARLLLHLERVSVDYGKLRALRSINFEVRAGEIIAVLGANGAGKTTLTQAICGLIPLSGGKILFNGAEITTSAAYRRARLGIALCHEGRRLFNELTTRENIELGAAYASRSSTALEKRMARIYELFPVLRECANTLAGKLSGGQQQMVAIARALVSEPSLLILDELSLGLAPQIVDQLFAALPQILHWGISIVLIEQNVYRSLAISNRVYILERGYVSFSGTPAELERDETLHQAYFGDRTKRSRALE